MPRIISKKYYPTRQSLAKTTHYISPHPIETNKALRTDAALEVYYNLLRD